LFPLVIIIIVGLFPFDKSIVKYALPLALIGWVIAFYHNLLYYGIIPESVQPCSQGVSCSEVYIDWFGFLTIPLLSLLSFSTIVALLFILKRRLSK
jgi:disulfide bond formation protein DsbB